MGVYHFMGLGRSVGAITGPLSYLAMRYQRWNADDQRFFGRSGERSQHEAGERVGDIQALVFFTSPEVYGGEMECLEYVDNKPGTCPHAAAQPKTPMREALVRLIPGEWGRIKSRPASLRSGAEVRGTIYWCLVDRSDLLDTFRRAATVLAAARGSGKLGKEAWINLTGGDNVVQLALQLAAGLILPSSRYYYVQAESAEAQRCIRWTREQGYWIDLPLLPIAPDERARSIAAMVEQEGHIEAASILGRATAEHWTLFNETHPASRGLEVFTEYLQVLCFQGLIQRDSDSYSAGPQWRILQPYYSVLADVMERARSLSELTRDPHAECWFKEHTLLLG